MKLSRWGSLTLSSKRVWAEMVGFFHRRWWKRMKGEKEMVVDWKILYLRLDNGFMCH